MTNEELRVAFGALRSTVADIIGFHALSEDENLTLSAVKRLEYDAQVYAGGVSLAKQVAAIADALDEDAGD
jgi:hypothetical protein